MDFILIILLFLFVYLVIVPLFRLGSAVHRVRKQTRSFFDGINNAGARQPQSPQPEPRKKKFDSTDGEYVDFEEIAADPAENPAQQTASHGDYSNSSQIEDAEWEDV